MRTTSALGFLALLTMATTVATAAGCGGPHTQASVAVPKSGAAGSASCKVRSIVKPLGQPRAGATVALAKIGNKNVALIADEDARAIEVVDLETQKELGTTPLDGAPSQLIVTTDGRILVLLRDRSQLQVLEAETVPSGSGSPLLTRCAVDTAPEPVSIAVSPDDSTVLVSSAWGRALTVYGAERLERSYQVGLAREPRSVVVSDDGATAFISHAVGSVISEVDLKKPVHTARTVAMVGVDARIRNTMKAQRKEFLRLKASGRFTDEQISQFEKGMKGQDRMGCQGFALAKSVAPSGRVLAPQVFVDPGTPEQRPEGYGSSQSATETPAVAVLDDASGEPFEASLNVERGLDWRGEKSARDHREECLLPRAAVVDPKSRMLLVSCFGIDNVIAYDAAAAEPQSAERRRWSVGAGPNGIAVDPEQPRAFVWSQFDRTLSVLPLDGADLNDEKASPPARVTKIALSPLANKVPTDIALGRIVFHAAGDSRISKDGRACASCHPDGRDDAITWATPEGPRRSIMLAGRVGIAAPYAWNGTTKTLNEHLLNTFDRLDGTGLKSLELEGLVAYLSTMKPPVPHEDTPKTDAKVTRGAEIFASKDSQCSSCHAGATFTDGLTHDVKSKTESDRGTSFKTPTLHLVGGTGPYFHDGRYKTLHDLLRDVDGKMGHTKQLSENDLDSLEAYLRTL